MNELQYWALSIIIKNGLVNVMGVHWAHTTLGDDNIEFWFVLFISKSGSAYFFWRTVTPLCKKVGTTKGQSLDSFFLLVCSG